MLCAGSALFRRVFDFEEVKDRERARAGEGKVSGSDPASLLFKPAAVLEETKQELASLAEPVCSLCDDESAVATHRCVTCAAYLCSTHSMVHTREKGKSSHKTV